MPIIERRAAAHSADLWQWPAGIHPVLRRVLAQRPIESPADLDLELKHLIPVGRFDALPAAVELLLRHRNGHVVIVGDFDADGATSTALCVLTLADLGFPNVSFFIPDRFELGYGLSSGVVARIADSAPSLIVTVDNGISSVEGVAAARHAGIDVLITDHHSPPGVMPEANVIVNPNLPGDSFPGKQLAGVGVAFYLLAALGKALGSPGSVTQYLDLVALGTVADLVRLDRLNRILVEQGLRRIRAGRCRPGIRALCAVSGTALDEVTAANLGFQIGPRLNAAGRLDDMTVGVRCLLTTDEPEAHGLAAKLDRLNRERREIESRMKAEAMGIMDTIELSDRDEIPSLICLRRDDWHEGLVGLIASRIKDRYHRPTFVFAPAEGGALKGSGRSISGFHLRDALAEVDARHPGLIARFGGHAMAAGLTVSAERFPLFQEAIGVVAREKLGPELLAETLLTDGELDPQDLALPVARVLRDSGPWGQGFPEPCFDGRFELVDFRILKDTHLQMNLRPLAAAAHIQAIAFNRGVCEWDIGAELRVVYRLSVNDYSATSKVQLIVAHVDAA
jgi:single-stranded-DNA-specific exonuclease